MTTTVSLPLRDSFHLPTHQGRPATYLCGNSLGPQPRATAAAVQHELDRWRELGVEGWFANTDPWLNYHELLQRSIGRIVGAKPEETVIANALTINLHLLLTSFYRPEGRRRLIIHEAGAFPSDQHALAAQIKWHGLDPATTLRAVRPRAGESSLRTEDILAAIAEAGDELALVLFAGVHYYTGQFFDLPAITRAGQSVGAVVGLDLAHAVGNVPLQLHEWGVDFAVWCNYKYLNGGPGAPGGLYVHERHAYRPELPRLAGWWGHEESTRFLMRPEFDPARGAAGWQVSTPPIMQLAALRASLDLFDRVGMAELRSRSLQLTGMLYEGLQKMIAGGANLRLLTPAEPASRGAQVSIFFGENGRSVFDRLSAAGIIADWREDNLGGTQGGVIRVAPAPLYTSEEEVERVLEVLREAVL